MIIAYIDPLSGIAIINSIIAFFVACFYNFRKYIYKIFDGKTKTKQSEISLFSEGKQYLSTFIPIINNFIKEEVHIRYMTLDINDPILEIDNKYLESSFLGFGYSGYKKASEIESKILISTTPNIDCNKYPIKRSNKTKNLVHVFHSISDISIYKKGSLNSYDTVILGGNFQLPSIRKIEKINNLKHKKCYNLGMPYLDYLVNEKNKIILNNKQTLLIASSWGDKSCLISHGTSWIKKLSGLINFDIIVRPHPQSFISDIDMIKNLKTIVSEANNIFLDLNKSPSDSMAKATFMISDTSSIRYDFAFIYEKPAITLNINKEDMISYEYSFLNSSWDESVRHLLGPVLNSPDLDFIVDYSKNSVKKIRDINRIRKLKNNTIKNFGNSSQSIVRKLIQISSDD